MDNIEFENFNSLIFSSKVIKVLASIFYVISIFFLLMLSPGIWFFISGFLFQTFLVYLLFIFSDLIKLAVQIETKIDINNNQINNKLIK